MTGDTGVAHRGQFAVETLTREPEHHFFGYYEKTPWSGNGRYVLSMEVGFTGRLPERDDVAVIGVVDRWKDNEFRTVAETRAWNWQQGAMAQWAPWSPDREIIYNDLFDGRLVSVVHDIETGERRVLPMPVASVSPDGRFAICLNFARLTHARGGYGYSGVADPWESDLAPSEDGIFWMDLRTGDHRLILSYAQLASFGVPGRPTGKHWVDHVLVNPASDRFLLLHRFNLPDGGFFSRLLTANPDGSELFSVCEGMASHFCWRNDRQLLAWARRGSYTTKLRVGGLFSHPPLSWALTWIRRQQRGWVRQRMVGDRFTLFTDRSREAEPVGVGILETDGHPSFSPDGRWMLVDTYPDAESCRDLLLYDYEKGRAHLVGRFLSPPPYHEGGSRCDLHPRWNRDGTQVCIDSAHEGTRQMYVIDVEPLTAS